MARLTKTLRARIDELPLDQQAAVMAARRQGYTARLDAAGNILLDPPSGRPRKRKKKKPRALHANHYDPFY